MEKEKKDHVRAGMHNDDFDEINKRITKWEDYQILATRAIIGLAFIGGLAYFSIKGYSDKNNNCYNKHIKESIKTESIQNETNVLEDRLNGEK